VELSSQPFGIEGPISDGADQFQILGSHPREEVHGHRGFVVICAHDAYGPGLPFSVRQAHRLVSLLKLAAGTAEASVLIPAVRTDRKHHPVDQPREIGAGQSDEQPIQHGEEVDGPPPTGQRAHIRQASSQWTWHASTDDAGPALSIELQSQLA